MGSETAAVSKVDQEFHSPLNEDRIFNHPVDSIDGRPSLFATFSWTHNVKEADTNYSIIMNELVLQPPPTSHAVAIV